MFRRSFLIILSLAVMLLVPAAWLSGHFALSSTAYHLETSASSRLKPVETLWNMGLHGADAAAFSPDGRHLYVTSYFENAVTTFFMNPTSGRLYFINTIRDGTASANYLNGATSVAVSPDGKHVYVAAWRDDAVTLFNRHSVAGTLTWAKTYRDGIDGINDFQNANTVVISPDGKHVYISASGDDAITVFNRDATNGLLTWLETHINGVDGVDGLGSVNDLALSPDDKFLYATSFNDDAVAIFRRDLGTGALTFDEAVKDSDPGIDGLGGVSALTISPDGNHLYASSYTGGTLVAFSRSILGDLTYLETETDGVGGADGLGWPTDLLFSDDGNYLFISSAGADESVATYSRSPSTGEVSYSSIVRNRYGGITDLNDPNGLIFNPAGSWLFAVNGGGSVVSFQPDGTSGALTWMEQVDSATKLDGPIGMAVGDAGCIYLTGNDSDSLHAFVYNAAQRRHDFRQRYSEGYGTPNGDIDGLEGARAVATFKHFVYVAGHDDDAITLFSRIFLNCGLSYEGAFHDGDGGIDGLDGVQNLAISPDGKHLYATGEAEDAVAVFAINDANGSLTSVDLERDGDAGVDGLNGAYYPLVSHDGKHVYVASFHDDAVAAFSRDETTGALTFIEYQKLGEGTVTKGLDGSNALALSPDGKHLYVAGRIDDTVSLFLRNPANGGLTYVIAYEDSNQLPDGLDGARDLAMTPDGRMLLIASQYEDAVAAMRRDPDTGLLTGGWVLRDGEGGMYGLDTANALLINPDNGFVYVSGYDDDALTVLHYGYDLYLPALIR